ncbi:uncharacterized protein MONBRDRAFT_33268 [Monosiga brevicollis MX1]|uniref:Phosphoinositide phospholipase C n=1 Tax=Monosiga brevicollis TaxID=81824 RepID=A9V4G2_MONBE|nr:uncharacterized protein MONBRDRAFT_33268 [Monosiga brevicollis MX1]EDQ87704.1 predicted protein [Monosiga brevicollis MX1]|eukprot:XP_001747624.1 hypothetical protein [Monosiga brevicollis MX1]
MASYEHAEFVPAVPPPMRTDRPILKSTSSSAPSSQRSSYKKSVKFTVDAREFSRDDLPRLNEVADVIQELFRGSVMLKVRGHKLYERYIFFEPEREQVTWFSKKNNATRSIPIRDFTKIHPGKGAAGFNTPEAADASTKQQSMRRQWIKQTFDQFDTDSDGQLSKAETLEATKALLNNIDSEHLEVFVNNLFERLDLEQRLNSGQPLSPRPSIPGTPETSPAIEDGAITPAAASTPPTATPSDVVFEDQTVADGDEASTANGKQDEAKINGAENTNGHALDVPPADEILPLGADDSFRCTFDQFFALVTRLKTRREVFMLLQKYAKDGQIIEASSLRLFLELEQHVLLNSLSEAEQLIAQHEPIEANRHEHRFGLDGFTEFLQQHEHVVSHEVATPIKWSSPLHHYYFAASHNSYLAGGQIQGVCTPDAVKNALDMGARSLEIDIWHADGKLQVYHGHTRTTPCEVEDVLKIIKDHAFADTDAPLLLIMEMHVDDIELQRQLIESIKSHLGSILYVPDAQRGNRLPLLEKVRGKVFIASQKLGAREEAQDEPVDVLEYDEFSFYADVKKKRNKKNKKIKDEPRKIPVLPGSRDFGTKTRDIGLHINNGRFQRTRGLVEKPFFLSHAGTEFNPTWTVSEVLAKPEHAVAATRALDVTIISAQNLQPSPDAKAAQPNPTLRVIDPYVHIEILGLPRDREAHTTRALDNNAIDPYWNESCKFVVTCPPSALLQILVLDDDIVHDNFLGTAVLPFEALQPGYRTVQLYDRQGRIIENSTVFLKLDFESSSPHQILEERQVQMTLEEELRTNKPGRPALSNKQGSRRASIILDADFEAPTLEMVGHEQLDNLFGNCNTAILELKAYQSELERNNADIIARSGLKGNKAALELAMDKLASKISGVKYRVVSRTPALDVEIVDESTVTASAQGALDIMHKLCEVIRGRLLRTMEMASTFRGLAMQVDEVEDTIEEVSALGAYSFRVVMWS